MSQLFTLPQQVRLNSSGTPYASAKAYFYRAGTLTAQDVYTTPDLSTPHSQPVQADSAGQFPPIWLDPEADYEYRVQIKTSADVQLDDFELSRGSLTQSQVGEALYLRTSAEQSASVVPTHYHYPPLSVERYGADPTGAEDATAAFNRAFSVGAATTGTMVFSATGGTFKILGTLTPDTNKVGFDGNGCILDSTTKSSGDLWVPTNSDSDNLRRCALNKSHPLENFVSHGPGSSVAVRFLFVDDTVSSAGTECFAGLTFRNGGSWDWQTHYEGRRGCYFTSFENWFFDSTTAGGGSSTFVLFPAASQAGERNSFYDCRFGGLATSTPGISQANGNADTHFINCSFNGLDRIMTVTAGEVYLTNCHLEVFTDGNYWIHLSADNSSVYMSGTKLVVGSNRTTYPLFYCDSTVQAGIFSVRDCFFASGFTYDLPLIAGTGPAKVENLSVYKDGTKPAYYSAYLNRLADGGFEANALTPDGWQTAGGTAPAVSSTYPRSGTYALRLEGVNAETNSAKVEIACAPGQIVVGQCWLAVTDFEAGNTLRGRVLYVDVAGNTLSGSAFATITVEQTTYTRYNIGNYARAPAGTAKAVLIFDIFGTSVTGPFGHVDDVILNVH